MLIPRPILMIAFEDAQVLDITGPLEILAGGNDLSPDAPAYRIRIAARSAGPFRTTSGMRLVADCSFLSIGPAELDGLDTLLVAGDDGTGAALQDEALIAFIARAAGHARRIASICSGAFLLAAAGLLRGRRATTHWNAFDLFERFAPETRLDRDALFVRDGNVWTSAGITAGMDMALALVEEDLGREAALSVAQRHVMYMMRPGGQSQFSRTLTAQAHERGRLGGLVSWMRDNPQADLSVPALAARAAMSERSLARVFQAETG